MKWIEFEGKTYISKADLISELESLIEWEKLTQGEKNLINVIVKSISKINGD